MLVRKAAPADALDVLAWRNDPAARAMSRTPDEVQEAAHIEWFNTALDDPRRTLLIGEADGHKVGMVRFDQGQDTEVSITVNPACRGRGLGQALLAEALKWVRGDVVAEVRPENLVSQRLFERAGFTFTGLHDGLRRYVGRA